jgi:hypothetical protein
MISCGKTDAISPEQTAVQTANNRHLKAKEKHIYYASWDSWGRTSRDCKGAGLCNFTACWFCCTEGSEIVDCDSRQSRAGEFAIIIKTVAKRMDSKNL